MGHRLRQLLVLTIMMSGGSIVGYDSGYLNGVLASQDFIRRYGVTVEGITYLTARTRSLFTSFQVVGTVVGCLVTGPATNWLGSKGSLAIGSAIYALGIALQTAALPAPVFIVGRICIGVALGITSSIIPTYMIECSSSKNRGKMFALYLLLLTSGNVIACGISMGTSHFTDSKGWRITVCFQLLIAGGVCLSAIVCPESPVILIKRGDIPGARRSLAILQNLEVNSDAISDALAEVQDQVEVDESWRIQTFLECFQGIELRRTMIGVGTASLTILMGCNFWFNYGTTFFEAAGVNDSYLISLILALINFVFSAPAIYLMEKAGRRNCLMVGAAITSLTQLLSGVIHDIAPDSVHDKHMLVAGSVIFIATYAATWGVGGWVVMTEPFSHRLRIPQTALTMITFWVCTWLIGFIVPYLVDSTEANLGTNICYIWAATCAICLLWTYAYIPEFAGLSITEMDRLFQEQVPAWRSKEWKRRLQLIDGVSPGLQEKNSSDNNIDDKKGSAQVSVRKTDSMA